jgi:hypothetical protein
MADNPFLTIRNHFDAVAEAHAERYKEDYATRVVDLETKLEDLSRKYRDLVTQLARTRPLAPIEVDRTAPCRGEDQKKDAPPSPPPPPPPPSPRSIESLTWDEVTTAAYALAKKKYRRAEDDPDRIQAGVLFPQYLLPDEEPEQQHGDDTYVQLIIRPYIVQYDLMRAELLENARKVSAAEQTSSSSHVKLDIVTTVVPSQWLIDFLYVFERARRIGATVYPQFRQLENIFFTTRVLNVLDRNARTAAAAECERRNYALDIGYHLVRFGSMFTTALFAPIREFNVPPATYSDFELFVHYAMRTCEEVNYKEFLTNPAEWLQGQKYLSLVTAVRNAAERVVTSFRRGLFFKATKQGLCLYKRTVAGAADDARVTKEVECVPQEIMAGLALDVLENVTVYERTRQMASHIFMSDMRDLRVESPIGRLLNFDQLAFREFRSLHKEVGNHVSSFNAQLSDRLPTLRCVHRVYALLVSAAATVFASRTHDDGDESGGNLRVSTVIQKCMRVPEGGDGRTVVYSSTAEAFPGLLFSVMLAAGEEDAAVFADPWTDGVTDRPNHPGMSNETYFTAKTYRKAFFDTFGAYAFKMPALDNNKSRGHVEYYSNNRDSSSGEGIRWMTDKTLTEIRVSAANNLHEAQAAYVSLLGYFAQANNVCNWIGNKRAVLDYFRSSIPRYRVLTTSFQNNVTTDSMALFTLPTMYFFRVDFVDVSPRLREPSNTDHYNNRDVLRLLQSIGTTTTDDCDVSGYMT